jgi:hypothetical protein
MLNESLAHAYTYEGNCGNEATFLDVQQIKDMLLSPRGCYIQPADKRKAAGFAVCRSCKWGLEKHQMPKYAIANNYCFGEPACLQNLTEIELAMLSPIRTHGYCFSYTGGVKKQLKGSLCYYKVGTESISRTVAQELRESWNSIGSPDH